MEKYKRWIDQGTGINPFVPFIKKGGVEDSFFVKLIRFFLMLTVKPIMILVKFPILLVMLFTAFIITTLVSLIPIWFIRRPLQRYTNFVIFRSMLFLFGFYNIHSTYVNKANKPVSSSLFSNFSYGDVIFANHISYIEVLYLAYAYAPVFTRIVTDSSDKLRVQRISALSCFFDTLFASDKIAQASSSELLSDLVKDAKKYHLGPIIVFPEAITSNGKAILKFQNVFDDQLYVSLKQEQLQIHVMTFMFTYRYFSPSYHIQGTMLSHVLSLLAQFYNTLHVRVMQSDDKSLLSPLEIRSNLETLLVSLEEENHGHSLAKKKCVAFGVQDKQEFNAFWKSKQGEYYGNEKSE